MNTSPQAGRKKEKKRTETETEVETQTHILAGMRGVLRGIAIEVEVGAEINLIGIEGPGTPVTGSPQIPVTAGITETAARQLLSRMGNELFLKCSQFQLCSYYFCM